MIEEKKYEDETFDLNYSINITHDGINIKI
jgi:hypothetical protein